MAGIGWCYGVVGYASHIREQVQVPSVTLPFQLPANAPGKPADDGPSAWAPADLHGRLGWSPGFGLAQPWLLHPFVG